MRMQGKRKAVYAEAGEQPVEEDSDEGTSAPARKARKHDTHSSPAVER